MKSACVMNHVISQQTGHHDTSCTILTLQNGLFRIKGTATPSTDVVDKRRLLGVSNHQDTSTEALHTVRESVA